MSENKAYLPLVYATFYPGLRDIARKHGYALALHGSLMRDMDILLVPWDDTVEPIETVLNEMGSYYGFTTNGEGNYFDKPTTKPHGRVAYIIQTGIGYLDISVMPTVEKEQQT